MILYPSAGWFLTRDSPAVAGLVLDDHGLPDVLRQLLPDETGEKIVAAAGRKTDDQADRSVGKVRRGIALCSRRLRGERNQRRESDPQQGALEPDHGHSSAVISRPSVFRRSRAASSAPMPPSARDHDRSDRLPPSDAV